ncbi:hypothetical protein [Mycobacteroides abscessus]|uniref:hypothetical protein n=1 Tax=Mycobacteroides abscessus TaxID=36809 RepID=UPI001041EAEB|nr:hypothetical protein [Mycobacteroides abscessus]MDO3333870.1 hypothetical protein [Mycobacteroides abscessus subsp. bolletii]QSM86909.1 hypothetical protein I3U44_13455 [Mycobacteroides abscessus subsp. bolletii]
MTDYTSASASEMASPLALTLLDELRVCLLECQLVLEVLVDEADLNLDELATELYSLQQPARQAYGAASLLGQGAELDEAWSAGSSRPKAIFARHAAAVRAGALRVPPTERMIDTVERQLRRSPRGDAYRQANGPRPRCTAITAKTNEPCSNAAIYLGSGTFAAHCYPHSTRAEREQYRKHQEALSLAVEDAWAQRKQLMRLAGSAVAAEWLQRRDVGRAWLNLLAEG